MKQKDSLTYDIFNRYTKVIPDFISTSDRVHKAIYDEMCNINNNFKSLFTDSVLTKAKLAMINTNITIHIENIDEYLLLIDQPLDLFIEEYYDDMINDLQEVAVQLEEYEIAQNLKNYYDTYAQ